MSFLSGIILIKMQTAARYICTVLEAAPVLSHTAKLPQTTCYKRTTSLYPPYKLPQIKSSKNTTSPPPHPKAAVNYIV